MRYVVEVMTGQKNWLRRPGRHKDRDGAERQARRERDQGRIPKIVVVAEGE